MVASAPQRNYDVYYYLGLAVPIMFMLLGSSVIIYGIFVWVQTKLFVLLCGCEKQCRCCTSNKEKTTRISFRALLLSALKIIYGNDLVEHKRNDKPSTVTLYGREFGQKALLINFHIVTMVLSCAGLAFWSSFLLAESDQCDPRIDCFAFHAGNESIVQNNPLMENCTNYQNSNYTIQCYDFAFDYADGLGHSGGILVLSKVVVSLHISLWIAISSLLSSKSKKIFKLIGAVYVAATVIILALVFVALGTVPFFRDRLFEGFHNFLQIFAYFLAFLSIITVSGPMFILFTKPYDPASAENDENAGLVNSYHSTDSEDTKELQKY